MSANVIAGPPVFATEAAAYFGKAADGVVHVPGVRYGERLDAADRFSPLGDPSPGHAQASTTVFPQLPGSLDWLMGPALSRIPQDEDSFLLDIWTPEGARDLPVLVFLPGGAFISGAGNVGWYDGARLAAEGNAVVVTVSYRLGAVALLGGSGAPLNLGVQDILQALTWISDNITAFGGNPTAVTLAGHSAGAWYAYVLSLTPAARGLFCRTALFSLPWQPPLSAADYEERRELFNGFLEDALDGGSLATAPIPAILEAQAAVGKAYAGRGLGLVPAADGELVPDWAMDFRRAASSLHVESLLLSSTDNEAAAFLHAVPVAAVGPEQVAGFVAAHFEEAGEVLNFLDSRLPAATPHAKLEEAMSLHQFHLAATELAGLANTAGVASTLLRFSVPSRLDGAGSPHCFELPFLFGNREDWQDAPMLRGFREDNFDAVSNQLRPLLLSFVAKGRAQTASGERLALFTADHPQLHAVTAGGVAPGTPEPEFHARR